MNQDDYKNQIDAWLPTLGERRIRKFYQIVVSSLQDEQRLLGKNTCKIPLHKIEKVGITDSKQNILLNLHNKEIIEVSRKVTEPSTIYQPNGQTSFSRQETINDNPAIADDPNTNITLLSPAFDYLAQRLLEIVKQYEALKTPDKPTGGKPEWRDDFHWEGNKYVFGVYGSIAFDSPERKALFKKLTDKKGGWVKITELKSNKDERYVRSTIRQIEQRTKKSPLNKDISIPSTQKDDAEGKPEGQGAYRIKFHSKP